MIREYRGKIIHERGCSYMTERRTERPVTGNTAKGGVIG